MFGKARIKLTAWYLLIIMLISMSFSAVIYKVLTVELDRFTHLQRLRMERNFGGRRVFIDPELASETKHRLILFLIIVNSGILIVAGGLAYFLAGKTLKPIKDMIDEQNQFITDASHELKTPLTSLKSAMEVHLRDKYLSLEDAKKLIFENIEDVNKLQSLSEELLQLTQYQKPINQTKLEIVSLSSIIVKSIQKVKPLALKKAIEITDKTQDFEFECDQYALSDLFVILFDNAVKYSPRGKSVTVTSKKSDKSILITVADRGIGIDEKDLPHIFDRFYRADLARSKDDSNGYGLGLSIAKKIVDTHHGMITVESKLSKGSKFTIHLPIKQTSPRFQPSFFS